jgi:hypothetical protein
MPAKSKSKTAAKSKTVKKAVKAKKAMSSCRKGCGSRCK